MGLLDRVGLFDRNKMDKKAGEWAAKAMGCMVFADGNGAGAAEIAAAQGQVKTNRVLKDSIGSRAAEAIFQTTIEAIGSLPAVMLQTHEAELAALGPQIEDITARNFAMATVIAVAMGDGTITHAERAMMVRFHAMLRATISIPDVGQTVHALENAAIQSGIMQPAAAQSQASVSCPGCSQPTQFYAGHGHWCAACGQYAPGAVAQQPQRERQDTPAMPLPAVDE